MALSPLVSVDELAAWMATPTDQLDSTRAGMVLDAVSGVVRAVAGVTWDGVPVPEQVRAVALTVAARTYRNPTGATSQTAGPFSASGADVGGILLTEAEESIIRSAVANSRGLWTQETTRGECTDTTVWVPTPDGAPFPWYGDDVVA